MMGLFFIRFLSLSCLLIVVFSINSFALTPEMALESLKTIKKQNPKVENKGQISKEPASKEIASKKTIPIGYSLTIAQWNSIKEQKKSIESIIDKLYKQVIAVPLVNEQDDHYLKFNILLSQKFPGSSYAKEENKGIFVYESGKYDFMYTTNGWFIKKTSVLEAESSVSEYDFFASTVLINNKTNKNTIIINEANPELSYVLKSHIRNLVKDTTHYFASKNYGTEPTFKLLNGKSVYVDSYVSLALNEMYRDEGSKTQSLIGYTAVLSKEDVLPNKEFMSRFDSHYKISTEKPTKSSNEIEYADIPKTNEQKISQREQDRLAKIDELNVGRKDPIVLPTKEKPEDGLSTGFVVFIFLVIGVLGIKVYTSIKS